MGGTTATQAEIEAIRRNLGLDRPWYVQIGSFYANLARGDLGRSLLLGQPVLDAIIERLPATLSLALYSLVLTLVFGLATGIVAALRHNTWVDQLVMTGADRRLPAELLAWVGVHPLFFRAARLLPTGGYIER